MTAAFVLGINMFIAGIFAVAFGVVAATNRTARGAKWVALGYSLAIGNVALEFLLSQTSDPTVVGIGIFLIVLLAMTFCLVGVAHHYRVEPPWFAVAAIWGFTILATPVIFTLPYASPLRAILYQFPYFAAQSLFAFVILRSGRRQALDLLLLVLQVVAALIYLSKPLIGFLAGTATAPQGYMATTYAAISQSLAAVTLVMLGLVLLLVMMRDTAAEMMARSETDALSGLLNRRGFEDRADRALAQTLRSGGPAVLVTADLDRFKAINDSYGHAAGDSVIAEFARVLGETAPDKAMVGRLGGEEFAVFIVGANLADGRAYAETVRAAFAAISVDGIDHAVSASFGAAQLMPGDTLFELARRADTALYRAKAGGRNQVRVALNEMPPAPPPAIEISR
ncbi:sensor domain-containing diguanylate cyclase [Sphingopyxis witflariensis]|uniref:diguanylate cyclase n=1 Tax=Sphingopyxis witflariensis TaxID=173675 RepID=A0A246JQT1_9SPHN|nr:GGDEF domain-containing protein [Sphingopyxis witflariensis]OWQ95283.1 GGDEF domain-containing protein [Sphingopyxis witflariensis]